jgi:hypothetical protein
MHSIHFEGAREIQKPVNLTDDQCSSIYALKGVDAGGYEFWVEAWKPSYEDLQALNQGEPIYLKILSNGLPPIFMFTMNEKDEPNF